VAPAADRQCREFETVAGRGDREVEETPRRLLRGGQRREVLALDIVVEVGGREDEAAVY